MQNCWDFKKCGREKDCPAALATKANGYNGGTNGGRACAYIAGTFCGGAIQGTFKDKSKDCGICDFYLLLKKEHREAMSVIKFSNYVKYKAK